MVWILLVLLYGILKGVREIVKKKALEYNSILEVLLLYTLLSFLFVSPDIKNALGMAPRFYFYILLKSFVIFLAWLCGFKAINQMPISLFGVLDLSRVLFSTLLGVLVLGEVLNAFQIIGLILVSAGLLLLRYKPRHLRDASVVLKEATEVKYILMAFACSLLNAASGFMDKLLMKDINSSQLQFWYLFFLLLMYLAFVLVTGTPLRWKAALRNKWIWLLSILFVIADRALFIANGIGASRVTVMTLLKQAGCVVTILAGRFLFHEKETTHRLICAGVIIAGIVIAVL